MKILVVEDDHKIANALKKGLTQEGYIVDVAYTGNEGLDMAQAEEYDLLILDLMLPEISGIEISTKLRKENNHVPILMLTARGNLDDKVKGLNSGADDYLTKPFAFEELLARIRALLRRPQNLISDELVCEDLTLNTSTFVVKRNNKEISLSKKEFSLLEYLMRHKNKTLSKDQIISHVWDYDSDVLPNTVEQYIGYLRDKIDKPFLNEKPLIQTVRGFGYKIVESSSNV